MFLFFLFFRAVIFATRSYFAMQSADECRCDNSFGSYGEASEGECDTAATGASTIKGAG